MELKFTQDLGFQMMVETKKQHLEELGLAVRRVLQMTIFTSTISRYGISRLVGVGGAYSTLLGPVICKKL